MTREVAITLQAEDYAALDANAEPFISSLISGDWPALAAHYAEDAVLYPPGLDPVHGRAAIEAFFSAFPAVVDLVADVEKIDGSGDTAYLMGSSVVTFAAEEGGEAEREKLKFIEIHRKQSDGRWLMVADIWNPSPAEVT